MARVPWSRRSWRRPGHPLAPLGRHGDDGLPDRACRATTLGYAAGANKQFVAQLTTFVTTFSDMATAAVATALFVIVSTTSIRFLRRRFRYQTWLFIHWYSYAAVALAFGHELARGQLVRHDWADAAVDVAPRLRRPAWCCGTGWWCPPRS